MNSSERREKTIHLFHNNYNCAQSVFSAYASELGIDEKTARVAAAGFGGGMGALQKTCGAVTGGIMVLGGRFFDERDLPASKTLVYKKTRELIRQIERLYGSAACLDVLGTDIGTEEGLNRARAADLFHLKCEPIILSACDILDELLKENTKEYSS